MRRAVIVDFDDSFTFNIKEILVSMDIDCELINWKDLNAEVVSSFDAFVFGPGPGHPDEYQSIYDFINSILERKKFYFGVCLGHQLLWSSKGRNVVQVSPVHGESLSISTKASFLESICKEERIDVQFYNSLKVQSSLTDLENNYLVEDDLYLLASLESHFCTYQFHPESIGSSCPEALFRPLRDFLYN
ncbi:MAG: hypothetical protein GY909_12850 [Oligoflexia bacterium]|nr:hypothetical protein [Oligoflexia bacterium]